MIGQELFFKVFAKEIADWGGFALYDVEDVDGVTCYEENFSYNEGWYNYYEVTFRYEGKKYSFEKKQHTSDNVCETYFDVDTFSEVVAKTDLEQAIDKIIKGIEDESYGTWEEIVGDLEEIKLKFQ